MSRESSHGIGRRVSAWSPHGCDDRIGACISQPLVLARRVGIADACEGSGSWRQIEVLDGRGRHWSVVASSAQVATVGPINGLMVGCENADQGD